LFESEGNRDNTGFFLASYFLQAAAISPSFTKVAPKAQARLGQLYTMGLLVRTDLEDCVFDSLADFSETDQLKMCDAFAQANLVNVRNKTAFFIGILKRHRSQHQVSESQQESKSHPTTTATTTATTTTTTSTPT